MKVAVLHNFGEVPRYVEFPDKPLGKDEILVQVKAIALESVDRGLPKALTIPVPSFSRNFPPSSGIAA